MRCWRFSTRAPRRWLTPSVAWATGDRPVPDQGQYRSDLVADAAAIEVLDGAGLGVMSEESGIHAAEREVVVVLDPLDGSTNAARGIPWYASSLARWMPTGPGLRWWSTSHRGSGSKRLEGGGARRDGQPIHASGCTALGEAIVGFSGYPRKYFGWSQYRQLGAAALDLCAVAEGVLDGYAVVGTSSLGSWDYLGGMLICTESGAVVAESLGRELVVLDHEARRTPVAAGTPELLQALSAGAADSVVPSGV